MPATKRYCIQKLVVNDKKTHLKEWKNTNKCSDNLETLKLLCGSRHRIFDRTDGRVVYEP